MSDKREEGLAALERFAKLRGGPEDMHRSTLAELAKERAQSYSRAVTKVQGAYDALGKAVAALDACPAGERGACVERYDQARSEALRVRWELAVHREALGFANQEDIDKEWPVPPRRS
jgi:hypothetical protein